MFIELNFQGLTSKERPTKINRSLFQLRAQEHKSPRVINNPEMTSLPASPAPGSLCLPETRVWPAGTIHTFSVSAGQPVARVPIEGYMPIRARLRAPPAYLPCQGIHVSGRLQTSHHLVATSGLILFMDLHRAQNCVHNLGPQGSQGSVLQPRTTLRPGIVEQDRS